MAHIWSNDVTTGFSYDGTWTMTSALRGSFTLSYHLVRDTVDIPWLFPGANTLRVTDGIVQVDVTFPNIATDKTDPATLVTLFNTINADLSGAGAAYTLTSVVFDVPTDTFIFTFDTAVSIDWDNSNIAPVFSQSGVTGFQVGHTVPALNAKSRPDFMDIFSPQISSPISSSRQPQVSMAIPLQDGYMEATVQFVGTRSIDIRWSQLYAPGVMCPMTNEWHLVFDRKTTT